MQQHTDLHDTQHNMHQHADLQCTHPTTRTNTLTFTHLHTKHTPYQAQRRGDVAPPTSCATLTVATNHPPHRCHPCMQGLVRCNQDAAPNTGHQHYTARHTMKTHAPCSCTPSIAFNNDAQWHVTAPPPPCAQLPLSLAPKPTLSTLPL